MYGTTTQTQTWTITQARYVTSKIAADLDLMRSHYGWPSTQMVSDFAEEAAILLAKRFLGTVEYGFMRDGRVVFTLKYVAHSNGALSGDDRPGRVLAGLDLSGAKPYSWLTYSPTWAILSSSQRSAVEAELPINRGAGSTPQLAAGYWDSTRSYSSNGEGVARSTFRSA